MKNKEIIANAAVEAGILTKDEAEQMLRRNEDIPLHTLQGWRLRGSYKVRKDEKPIEVRLWKKKEGEDRFYLAKSYLYRKEQLEQI